MRRSVFFACAFLFVSSPVVLANAPSSKDSVRERYYQGVALSKASRWNEALAELRAAETLAIGLSVADRKKILPVILYEIGLAAQRLDQKAIAVDAFNRIKNRDDELRRKPEGWLIEQQQPWTRHEAARDGQHLLLPA